MLDDSWASMDFEAKLGTSFRRAEKACAALASVLLSTADLLILDEPTNHLDSEMADWLEEYLKEIPGSAADDHP